MAQAPLELAGLRALVTGAGGFIGRHLGARLHATGAEVHGTRRAERPGADSAIRWHQLDLRDRDAVAQCWDEVRPDLVFHLAGWVSGSRALEAVSDAFDHILAATVHLLRTAAERGARRIVVAGSLEEPDPGEARAAPASPYAAAKWAAAGYARMLHALHRLPVVWTRIGMVYGPDQPDDRKLIPYVTGALLRGEVPQLSSGARPVDWIYVEDVVEALIAAATVPGVEGETFDVASGRLITVRELVERLRDRIRPGAELAFGSVEDRPRERVFRADVEATAARLGWRATTGLDEGLDRTLRWYTGR